MPAGRPSKYDERVCEKVIELGKKGYSRAMIAREINCGRTAWYVWQEKHKEFADAIKESMFYCLAWWEEQGMKSLFADKFNSSSFIFQMKNRFPNHYKEKQEIEQKTWEMKVTDFNGEDKTKDHVSDYV